MTNDTWQQQLVQKHPQLFIRSFRGRPFSPGYPLCPDGWHETVARVVERVSEAANGYHVQFCEISERCGRLRIYWRSESTLPKAVERCIEAAVARGEARSACTCATCGANGRSFLSCGGRLLPLCSEHARGVPMPTRLQNIHLVRELVGGKIEIIARRKYEWRLDRFVELDPSSIEGQS